MSVRQKKSHYDYHPLPREEGEPDAMETIKLLPQAPREKLLHIFDEGTLRPGDLDHKSVMTLQQLSEPLQHKVIEYLQTERLFLFNSRSKAGFLVSACDRAKKGELDARGFGALDPWRQQLISECVPKGSFNLKPESEWVGSLGKDAMNLRISQNESECVFPVSVSEPFGLIKDRLFTEVLGSDCGFTRSRLKLAHSEYGSLRDDRTPSFYNLSDGDELIVKIKVRGGRKVTAS